MPQGSILGSIQFNVFINDLLVSIKNAELYVTDDNTITSSSGTLSQLIKDLQSEANKATGWFKMNNLIVNPEKFQATIIDKKWQNNNPTKININGKKVNSKIVFYY